MMRALGRRLRQRWPHGLLVLAVVAADQASKLLVLSRLSLHEVRPVLPGWFDLTLVMNSGGVWGLGSDMPGPLRFAVFLALPGLITLFAIGYALSLPLGDRLRHACVALVVGGAIGNLIDRVRLSGVVDFLSFHWREAYHWPAFNLADSAICVGIAALLVLSLFEGEPPEAAPSPEQGSGA